MKKLKKENAIRICLYLDKNIYKDYKIYALMNESSISSLIEKQMEDTINSIKKGKM